MSTDKPIEMTPSTGNVFADIGVKNPEEYLAKAKLASQIHKIVEGKTQKQIADILDIKQPNVSDLISGKLTAFSISRLITFLNKLNQDVEIVVKPAKPSKSKRAADGQGHLSVSC